MTDKPNDGSNDISPLLPKKDVFSVMPIVWGGILYLVAIILAYPCVDMLLMLGFVILFSVVILCLYRGLKHLVQGRYKSAVSLILVPLLLYFPMRHMGDVTYNIRLTLNEKQYLEEVKLIKPDDKGFRFKEFIWSDHHGEGTSLIYDESDEIELPNALRSQSWWKMVGENSYVRFYDCSSGAKNIKSHFYVVTIACPN
jgi:hypothetical protein